MTFKRSIPRSVLAISAAALTIPALIGTAVAAPGGTGAPTGNDGGTGATVRASAPAAPARVAPPVAPPAIVSQAVPGINSAVQPLRTQTPSTPQYTPVSAPQRIVIDNRPVIVQEVVVQEITVEETSPGLLILNPEVQREIDPNRLWSLIDQNTKGQDRQTLALAGAAAGGGALIGATAGAAVGALGAGVTGALTGAAAGAAGSGAAIAPLCAVGGILAGPVGLATAGVPCVITAGVTGAAAGAAIGGAAGLGAGAVAGGTAGAAAGAALAADSVPNARAAFQRVAADTVWELEDEARVNNGYEALVGEKPSDQIANDGEYSENLNYVPEDVSLNPNEAITQIANEYIDQWQPAVPPAPQIPTNVGIPNAEQFNTTANDVRDQVQTNVTNSFSALKNDVQNFQNVVNQAQVPNLMNGALPV